MSFKESMPKIRNAARDKFQQAELAAEKREAEFRKNANEMRARVGKFCNRVVEPALQEFMGGGVGDTKLESEHVDSDSQPKFIYRCQVDGKVFEIELLYWLAGSAMLCIGDYGQRAEFKIDSFEKAGLDEQVDDWLRKQLLAEYEAYIRRTGIVPEATDS